MRTEGERTGAFFGRRKGKRLRAGQDELIHKRLPGLRIVPENLSDHPAPDGRPTWLEVGFGGGEHLAARARAHPEVDFIGCEPFVNGMAKLLAAIEQEGLSNIRLWDDDILEVILIVLRF